MVNDCEAGAAEPRGGKLARGYGVGRGSPRPPLTVRRIGCRVRCACLSANGRLGEPSLPEARSHLRGGRFGRKGW